MYVLLYSCWVKEMKRASDAVIKVLGTLLLSAAVLKGHQLLTEPVANSDIWSNRAFLIFQVEFELALGISIQKRMV